MLPNGRRQSNALEVRYRGRSVFLTSEEIMEALEKKK